IHFIPESSGNFSRHGYYFSRSIFNRSGLRSDSENFITGFQGTDSTKIARQNRQPSTAPGVIHRSAAVPFVTYAPTFKQGSEIIVIDRFRKSFLVPFIWFRGEAHLLHRFENELFHIGTSVFLL